MSPEQKIYSFESLAKKTKELKASGKTIVLCHGHFNVLHPGHMRFLNFAKKQGDFLVVSILHPNEIDPKILYEYFPQKERAQGVANLHIVDAVCSLSGNVIELINLITPTFYIKGREFENKKDEIKKEIEAIEKNKGKVIFSSGDIEYSSFNFFSHEYRSRDSFKKHKFISICKKHFIDFNYLQKTVDNFKKLNMLVIGDTIVDQFIACDTLGVSSEAPVLAVKELNSKEFIGGAAIVAQHTRSLGANCHYLSVLGNDRPGDYVIDKLKENGINSYLLTDNSRPTTFKIRYMVENQKVLRVSRIKQHIIHSELESKLIMKLEELIPQMDGIIISDFVYGVITSKILNVIKEQASKHNIKVFGDLQCSSQIGDVSKLGGINLITPTEKEARIALSDYTSGLEKLARDLLQKTSNKALALTLGRHGILAYEQKNNFSEYFPALETNPIDVAGAGDSVLTGYALGITSNLNMMEATALSCCLAAISVMRIGNTPIHSYELNNYINNFKNTDNLI